MSDILFRLEALIAARKAALARDPGLAGTSYVARALARGEARVARKLGEEAVETLVAALAEDETALANEAADLLFHLLLLLGARGVPLADVFAQLEAREGVPGLDEAAARRDE